MSGPSPSELIQFFGEKVEVAQPFEMEAAEEDEAPQVLRITSVTMDSEAKDARSSLWISVAGSKPVIVATLTASDGCGGHNGCFDRCDCQQKHSLPTARIDLLFHTTDAIKLTVKGNQALHVTGYLQAMDGGDQDGDDGFDGSDEDMFSGGSDEEGLEGSQEEDESSEDEEDAPQLVQSKVEAPKKQVVATEPEQSSKKRKEVSTDDHSSKKPKVASPEAVKPVQKAPQQGNTPKPQQQQGAAGKTPAPLQQGKPQNTPKQPQQPQNTPKQPQQPQNTPKQPQQQQGKPGNTPKQPQNTPKQPQQQQGKPGNTPKHQ